MGNYGIIIVEFLIDIFSLRVIIKGGFHGK